MLNVKAKKRIWLGFQFVHYLNIWQVTRNVKPRTESDAFIADLQVLEIGGLKAARTRDGYSFATIVEIRSIAMAKTSSNPSSTGRRVSVFSLPQGLLDVTFTAGTDHNFSLDAVKVGNRCANQT